jgi:GTP-binding protein
MKFVDEATVKVRAGSGGRGAIGFRREKFVPFGGPDGGDGGAGGSVWLRAQQGINTLVDYRVQRTFRAQNGEPGGGQDCTGRGGDDLYVPMRRNGRDQRTRARRWVISRKPGRPCWSRKAQGRWETSAELDQRTPRQSGPGLPGEARSLHVELQLLADVGLLGLPNAGKSTLISAVSAARPKVADYPFTTLYPQLGVVSVGLQKSFVMADIPGLIEGAAEGAGLGIRFLKHLQRTHILLHLVDIAPLDPDMDPVAGARAIVKELKKFSPELSKKRRWLVLNKIDLLEGKEREERCADIVRRLRFKGPVYKISGVTGEGTKELCQAVMRELEG